MRNAGYFRMPTVAGDRVVFVAEDDLWTVPLAGGIARRLTAGLGSVVRPALSPDGATIAFSSREEFHNEVFTMPSEGGQPSRLTFLGANSTVLGWHEGRIIFSSEAGKPFLRWIELNSVDPADRIIRNLPYGPARDIGFGPAGGVVLGRNTADPARWKRYRGGTVGDLWVDAKGSGRFTRLLTLDADLAHPMWVGDRIVFVSDHEGVGNLYSCTPTGRGLRRLTDHDEYYARFASTDGTTIVYQHAAELWALDPGADAPRRIEVDFPSPRTQRNRRFVDGAKNLQGYAAHPKGHSVAIEARGRAVTMPLWEGPVLEYGEGDGVRYRLPRWMPDGERILTISDEGGEEALELRRPDGKRKRFDALDIGRVHEVAVSPVADLVAVANHRLEVMVLDLAKGTARVLDTSRFARASGLAWSPDGAWLAYSQADTVQTRSIKLAEIATGTVHAVTGTDFRDWDPVFDPAGRYLYFISYRHFDPVRDVHFFDLGFPRGAKPYLVALQADAKQPFLPEPKGLGEDRGAGGDGPPGEEKKKPKKGAAPEPVRVDIDGLSERVTALPVPEGRYVQLGATADKVLMLELPIEGSLEEEDDDEQVGGTLSAYDLKKLKRETLLQGISSFEVAGDGATMIARSGKKLRAVRAGEKVEKGAEHDPKPGRHSGWLDLGRIRISVDPSAEWRQMFREAWRLQRDNFWTQDLSRVDWQRVFDRYRPLVDKVATRMEFSDLIWEMQGELGTSHAYEIGGDHRPPPAYRMGYLGADVVFDERTKLWRIEHVVRGDAWDPAASSPLAAIGVGVSEGDTILAVNGKPAGPGVPPQALLVNLAAQQVELRVGDASGKKPRSVVVKTLADETKARYREWVEANRAHVHRATRGKVGYIHVPNMGAWGFSEFHRYYLSELDRDALIVDVRYNGGGNVSQILLEKLARRRIGYDVKRWGSPEPYPSDSVLGPIVCLTNEHAGSDGDIFTHAFKLMDIGPVVGKRTWGGVIGIWPRHTLADGGVTTQPEFAFWFTDVGWGVENHGTEPHHDIDIAPQDYMAGRDPQMDKALALMKAALKTQKPAMPGFSGRPNLSLPTLPPRAPATGGKKKTKRSSGA